MKFAKYLILTGFALMSLVVFQNCSKSSFSASTTDLSGVDDTKILSEGGCRFTDGAIENGQRVWAYQNSGVPAESKCVVEERSCSNGVLSGSFNFRTCTVGAAAACLFNNKQIESGKSTDAFETSSVTFGTLCAKQSRLCTNGTLSGTFEFATCAPGAALSCLFNGGQITHGALPVLAFQASTVPFGQTCASQLRSCNNGVLSGNASYVYTTCSAGAAASCIYNGQNIPHDGSTGDLFTTGSVPFGSTCPAAVKRRCTNGVLSNATATFTSCSAQGPPTCRDGQVFNTTSLRCESCSSTGQNFSISQKRCVATCSGGLVVRLRETNTASIAAAQNPIGFNLVAGFTINRNGIDYVVGKPGPSSNFMDKMNLAYSQNLEYNGVRDAFQSGLSEVASMSDVSVTIGGIFEIFTSINDSTVNLTGRDIVLTGSGNFNLKSFTLEGGSPASHQFTSDVLCK